MANTRKSTEPDFIIDSAHDLPYPLSISDHPEIQQFIRNIPLRNIRWEILQELMTPEAETTTIRASLIPTDDARTITVMVGTTVVGTLPDATVISESQIARVYASGYIPTCKLVITPGASVIAHISLYASDGGVPHNDPPANQWTLLPRGSLWRVEPTRLSPFNKIPDQSRVLVELRASEGMIFIHLNGVECGILDMDAADALTGAVDTAAESGLLALARGCVERRAEGQISLHIDALPFVDWARQDFQLPRNPLGKLIPYHEDPRDYRQGMQRFIHEHQAPLSPATTPLAPVGGWIRKIGPALLLLLATLAIIPAFLFESVSARGLVGIFGVSAVLCAISLWTLACRQRDTGHYQQPRHWNTVAPLAITALIPSLVFATIGLFHDVSHQLSTTVSSVRMTTLQTFPKDDKPLFALFEEGDSGPLPQPGRSPFNRAPVQQPPVVSTTPPLTVMSPLEAPETSAATLRSEDPAPLPRSSSENPSRDAVYQPPVPELPVPREPLAPTPVQQAPQAPQGFSPPVVFDAGDLEVPQAPLWPPETPTSPASPDEGANPYGETLPEETVAPDTTAPSVNASPESITEIPEPTESPEPRIKENKDLHQPEQAEIQIL